MTSTAAFTGLDLPTEGPLDLEAPGSGAGAGGAPGSEEGARLPARATRRAAAARGSNLAKEKVIFNDPEALSRRIREERRAERMIMQASKVGFRMPRGFSWLCALFGFWFMIPVGLNSIPSMCTDTACVCIGVKTKP